MTVRDTMMIGKGCLNNTDRRNNHVHHDRKNLSPWRSSSTAAPGASSSSSSDNSNRKPLQSLHVNSTPNKQKRLVPAAQPLWEFDKLEKPITNNTSTLHLPSKQIPEICKSPSLERSMISLPITDTCGKRLNCSPAADQQQETLVEVFRTNVWIEPTSDDEDLWTLKRASPIYDSDDEFSQYESPIKRKKTDSLDLNNRISDEVPILLAIAEDLVSESSSSDTM